MQLEFSIHCCMASVLYSEQANRVYLYLYDDLYTGVYSYKRIKNLAETTNLSASALCLTWILLSHVGIVHFTLQRQTQKRLTVIAINKPINYSIYTIFEMVAVPNRNSAAFDHSRYDF